MGTRLVRVRNLPPAIRTWPIEVAEVFGYVNYLAGLRHAETAQESPIRTDDSVSARPRERLLIAIVPGGNRRLDDELSRGEFSQSLALGSAVESWVGRRPDRRPQLRLRAWALVPLSTVATIELSGIPRPPTPRWQLWRRPPYPTLIVRRVDGRELRLEWIAKGSGGEDAAVRALFDQIDARVRFVRAAAQDWRARIDALAQMSPLGFEQFVVERLRLLGGIVQHTGASRDGGVDAVMATPAGQHVIVQCKRYSELVGPSQVRDLIGAIQIQRADWGILVGVAGFTEAAHSTAQNQPVVLLSLRALVESREMPSKPSSRVG